MYVVVFACEDFELPPDRHMDRMEIECFDFFPLNRLPVDLMPGPVTGAGWKNTSRRPRLPVGEDGKKSSLAD